MKYCEIWLFAGLHVQQANLPCLVFSISAWEKLLFRGSKIVVQVLPDPPKLYFAYADHRRTLPSGRAAAAAPIRGAVKGPRQGDDALGFGFGFGFGFVFGLFGRVLPDVSSISDLMPSFVIVSTHSLAIHP